MSSYASHFTPNQSVNAALVGREADMVPNNGGGYTFTVSPLDRLCRLLILGADKATYYATATQNFRDNNNALRELLSTLGVAVVEEIVAISVAGRAPKPDPAIYALASAATSADVKVRQAAIAAIAKVCRTPTHLFSFLTDYKALGGKTGGRAMTRALSAWYTSNTPTELAYKVVKYRQRGGWTHRDVLRLCRPAGYTTGGDGHRGALGDVLAFAANKPVRGKGEHLRLITAYSALAEMKEVTPEGTALVVKAIRDYGLPREAVPDIFLAAKPDNAKAAAAVWRALLMPSASSKFGMPMTAMLRCLNRMTATSLLADNEDETLFVVKRLTDAEGLKHARVHPIAVLSALSVYRSGRGEKGSLTWSPSAQVVAALEKAFVLSFGAVPPTNARYYVGLDISGSMGMEMGGLNNLSVREAASAMAMLWARTEPACVVKGFSTTLVDLTVAHATKSLSDIITFTDKLPMGWTDASLIIKDAITRKMKVDVFVVITDNEVNRGGHPAKMLEEYNRLMDTATKLVVIGMTATNFTIADPKNRLMMDVVGFDTAAPSVIADFVTST